MNKGGKYFSSAVGVFLVYWMFQFPINVCYFKPEQKF